jgi:chemotaxis protein MotA
VDLATLFGVILGFGAVIVGIWLGGDFMIFVDMPSVLITIGGAIAATLISFPLRNVVKVFAIAKNCFFTKLPEPADVIRKFVDYARLARRSGILALEEKLGENADPFLRRGLQFAIDGTPADTVREILTSQLDARRERHARGKQVLEAMGTYGPAFGMIGTLIGLVQMLRKLNDPSQIGAGMAVALITTFYGSILANLICLPLAGKLDVRSKDETVITELMIEGIIGIQSGDNPRMIEERLKSYLAPSVARTFDDQSEAQAA